MPERGLAGIGDRFVKIISHLPCDVGLVKNTRGR